MKEIPDKSIDLILCDLPYGITDLEWDKKIPASELWGYYNRVIKDNGAVILTATCKFGVELINANLKNFRYDLVWEKSMSVGFANSKRMPMRNHELILVFYKKLPIYNPQGLIKLENPKCKQKTGNREDNVYKMRSLSKQYTQEYTNYPKSVLKFANGNNKSLHPTQKPLELFKYLIATYTNPDDIVMDNCMGSGTTAVAAVELGRRFIGFETEKRYFDIAVQRLEDSTYI